MCACVLYLENAHLSAQRSTYTNYTKFINEHERHNFSNMTEEMGYESAGEFFREIQLFILQFIFCFHARV